MRNEIFGFNQSYKWNISTNSHQNQLWNNIVNNFHDLDSHEKITLGKTRQLQKRLQLYTFNIIIIMKAKLSYKQNQLLIKTKNLKLQELTKGRNKKEKKILQRNTISAFLKKYRQTKFFIFLPLQSSYKHIILTLP